MGDLRIIGGEWRGRALSSPPGLDTRPLLNRIRQSLFDALGQRLDGLVVADVFAGSGSFGFEALSRGAAAVHAVECGTPAITCLQRSAQHLGAGHRFHLHRSPLPAAASGLPLCDIMFCDPPFPWYREQSDLLRETITAVAQRCHPDGHLLVRGERGEQLPLLPGLSIEREQRYGRSWVAWFKGVAAAD